MRVTAKWSTAFHFKRKKKRKNPQLKTTSNKYAHAIHAAKTKYQSTYIRNKQQLLRITSQAFQAWYQPQDFSFLLLCTKKYHFSIKVCFHIYSVLLS